MTRPELSFDFKQPDYRPIMLARVQRLAKIPYNAGARGETMPSKPEIANARRRERYANDPAYRLRYVVMQSIRKGLKRSRKGMVTGLPYTFQELKLHLESLLEPWMSWDNYGKEWHIDHKKPVSKYDLSDPLQFLECYGLNNLQPLCAVENMWKSNGPMWDACKGTKYENNIRRKIR